MKKLNFESFRKEYTCYDDISDSWLEWFIGLFEGDGSFIITRSNKEIQFVISQYEPNINVLIDIKEASWKLVVSKCFLCVFWASKIKSFNGKEISFLIFSKLNFVIDFSHSWVKTFHQYKKDTLTSL